MGGNSAKHCSQPAHFAHFIPFTDLMALIKSLASEWGANYIEDGRWYHEGYYESTPGHGLGFNSPDPYKCIVITPYQVFSIAQEWSERGPYHSNRASIKLYLG